MNLAVHGLEGSISSGNDANSYYNDPQNLFKACDYVMTNPPFNVDEVDAEKVKNDPRLPFGLPGVNKGGKVSNANYLWIQYFYSYMSDRGKAGFVMSSQASSAGRDEAKVRERLIKSGHVDMMVAIRSGFFYTRTVPCELWFLNKAKPEQYKDKVLMLDARNVHRRVTRKIYDFSPEQLQNLLSIVWLYRGQNERFWELIADYLRRTVQELKASFTDSDQPVGPAVAQLKSTLRLVDPFWSRIAKDQEAWAELSQAMAHLDEQVETLTGLVSIGDQALEGIGRNEHSGVWDMLAHSAGHSPDLIRALDHACKLLNRLIDRAEKELEAKEHELWDYREIARAKKALEEKRAAAVEQLRQPRYFHRQAHWLLEKFPDGELRDVEGLVKLVNHAELEKNDWSLTPGRYVGVAPEVEDENFDFEEVLRGIYDELQGLNYEASELSARIGRSIEDLLP